MASSKTNYDKPVNKRNRTLRVKRLDIKQINTECSTTNHFAEGIDMINSMAFDHSPCKLALHLDESNNAPNDVALDKHTKHLIKEYGDPSGIDLIQIIKESLAEANTKLRSFKLRVCLEECA